MRSMRRLNGSVRMCECHTVAQASNAALEAMVAGLRREKEEATRRHSDLDLEIAGLRREKEEGQRQLAGQGQKAAQELARQQTTSEQAADRGSDTPQCMHASCSHVHAFNALLDPCTYCALSVLLGAGSGVSAQGARGFFRERGPTVTRGAGTAGSDSCRGQCAARSAQDAA